MFLALRTYDMWLVLFGSDPRNNEFRLLLPNTSWIACDCDSDATAICIHTLRSEETALNVLQMAMPLFDLLASSLHGAWRDHHYDFASKTIAPMA